MNRPLKRLLALGGSVALGITGALLFASPAHAHHPILSGSAICQANGTYKITWSVGNGDWGDHRRMKIFDMSVTPNSTVTGFAEGQMLAHNETVTGTQVVPGTTTSATLYVDGTWHVKTDTNGTTTVLHHESRSATATGVTGQCAPDPAPTFLNNCDGTINVHLNNKGNTSSATFNVTGLGNVSVAANTEKDVTVPAGTAGPIIVTKGGVEIGQAPEWSRPDDCPSPTAIGESTCDDFYVKLTNPAGNQPVEAKVTYGTQTANVTVQPGKTEVVKLLPSSEDKALIQFDGWDGEHEAIYEKPEDCEDLPQTGPDTMTYIASGGGLVAIGVVVFFLARRRLAQLRRIAAS